MIKQSLRYFRAYWLKDVSFFALLIILLNVVFVLPVLVDAGWLPVFWIDIMLSVLLFIGIWSAQHRKLQITGALIFVVFVYAKFVYPVSNSLFETVMSCVSILLNMYINFSLLFRDGKYNLERILGAINVYLFVALFGAYCFQLIALIFGEAIGGNVSFGKAGDDFIHYIYFSMVSLTTVGFGELYPVNQAARMLSVGLGAIGILYPAIVIAKLVAVGTDSDGFKREAKGMNS
ncbi:MAG: potassium channel family protein [Bacteroidia bacterium]